MPAIATMLFSLLSGIPGALGKYFQKKQELEEIKLQTEKAVAIAQQKMASELAKAEADTAIVRLKSTSPYFKYFTFLMWFGPFISGVFVPRFAENIFNNLALMPDWYVQSCVMIMFAIWGIQVAGPVVANVFSNLGSFLGERRQDKIELKKVDRKVFFEALREVQGIVTEADVKKYGKILDKSEN